MTKDTDILARRSLARLAGGALLIGSVSLMSAGCSDDAGPAEEAGRELDEAVESAEDSMSRTQEEAEAWAESASEHAGEEMEEMRAEAEDAMEDMRESTEETLNEAEAALDESEEEAKKAMEEMGQGMGQN